MRIEGQHGRRQAQIAGGFDEPRKHGLMPAMHAVEIADRQRDRAIGAGRKSAMNPHVVGAPGTNCRQFLGR